MVIDGYSAENIFVGNNLTHVDGLTYFFGENTVNNTVKGYTGGSDSVIDLGTDNFLTGVTPMANSGGLDSKYHKQCKNFMSI